MFPFTWYLAPILRAVAMHSLTALHIAHGVTIVTAAMLEVNYGEAV